MKLFKKSKIPQAIPLGRFARIRNNVLVIREVGGLGDILMHRMMFEDFKRVMPEAHITWAVPGEYMQAAEDHPYVDELVDCRTVDYNDFVVSYNTTTACGRYEMAMAPLSDKHRSDIWANHCGVILTHHNMHLTVNPDAQEWARDKLRKLVKGVPTVLLCPISAQPGKNLNFPQIYAISRYLQSRGFFVFATHTTPLSDLERIGVPTVWGTSIRQWIALVDVADYIVSVDTSTFHCAGGLGKPLTGIFTYIDGKVYGKYFKFSLVQKHRDDGWDCGPCFNWPNCPKERESYVKPCLTEITTEMLVAGIERMFQIWPLTLN